MAKSILFQRIRRILRTTHHARQLGLKPREIEQLAADPSRRAFLRTALIGTGALVAGCQMKSLTALTRSTSPVAPTSLPPAANDDPVVILGGGAAGLAAAYTLQKAGLPFTIFEAAPRVGGRIFTERGVNNDGQFFERGAELVDTNHHDLIALAGELGLEIEDFSHEPGMQGYVGELYHIDGRLYGELDFVAAIEPLLAAVVAAQREMFGDAKPDVSYRAAHNEAFHRYDTMSLRAFLDRQGIDGWAKQALEIAFLCEYGRELDEQSALNLITLIGTDPKHFRMFGDSDESKRVKGGNDGIILKLRDAITGHQPDDRQNQIKYRHELIALRDQAGGLRCTFATPAGTVEVVGRQVICTLPFPLLRQVDGIRELGLSAPKAAAIARYQIGTNSKVCTSFRSRVWRQPGPGRAPFSGAVYANSEIQNYWESSRLQAGARGLITALLGGKVGVAANGQTIGRHVALIDSVFAGAKAAHDEDGVVMNWNKMPFNRGSYTCMAPGQYGEFFGAAGEPELRGRLLFAGEHASEEFTGFMNGAYETGIKAAEAIVARTRAAARAAA